MNSEGHVCSEIKGEKILVWASKRPTIYDNDRHPLYTNHRAFKVVALGGGGRPAYAKVERGWRIINKDGLRRIAGHP